MRSSAIPCPIGEKVLLQIVTSLGLDMERFRADLHDPALRERIDKDVVDGHQNGVSGTPTIFINGVRSGPIEGRLLPFVRS
jgi:predicted DsbA family dithiol-disulfide isomerase